MQEKILSKQSLRKWAKENRKKIVYDKNIILKNLRCLPEYQVAKNIMLFYPMDYEIDLLELLQDSNKTFYLPKIDGNNLLCCPYNKNDKLEESFFKTKEPLTKSCEKSKIDLVVVPALCCDINNYRLGYGGGFYDRFLCDYKGTTVSCVPRQLIVNTIFPEKHDLQVNIIITD